MIQLTSLSGNHVWINPSHVVKTWEHEGKTFVRMQDNDLLEVKQSALDVATQVTRFT